MTERYAHLINGALRRGAEVADWVFRKTGKRITGMGLRKILNRKW